MILKILISVFASIALFVIFVVTRAEAFSYERSGVIRATPVQIYPYLSQLKLGSEWSPYEKGVEMPKVYGGTDGQPGSWMDFGPSKSGTGRLELLEVVPDQMVKIRLTMSEPFVADNTVIYRLSPAAEGTRFSWTMEGRNGFMGKLMATFGLSEKWVSAQMLQGIGNLQTLVEAGR